MKSMTCAQLGGACEEVFHAHTFEEMAELSKQHGVEMYRQQEPAHLEAMKKMQTLMQSEESMRQWYEEKRAEFDALPET